MKARVLKRSFLVLAMVVCCVFSIFTNVNAVAPDEVSIPVSVKLRGELPETDEDFVIMMKAEDEYSPMPAEGTVDGIYTMTVTGEGSVLLPKVDYNKLGIYTYTIWQEPGTDERCIYDESVYKLTVSVVNSESGDGYEAVVALNKDDAEEKAAAIVFENVYRTSAEVTLQVEKLLDGKTPENKQFEFTLFDADGEEIQSVKNDADGTAVFETLRFNKAGEYSFSISEKEGSDSKIIYDETEYEIVITVTPEGEAYVAETVITADGEEVDGEMVFHNETVPSQPKTGDNTNITLYLLVMFAAVVTMAAALVSRRFSKR